MAEFDPKTLKKIGVLTSGGDAPGMNAAVRAVVRAGITHHLEIYGIQTGYQGLLDKKIKRLELRSVANLIQRGGTFLKTGRCPQFLHAQTRSEAIQRVNDLGLEALVVIGGNGSLQGAHLLWEEGQVPVIGIPGTIDNDIWGTDFTIGFDTAVNTALQAIDRIRDTADSHNRLFIVEVMGRDSGFIAVEVGLAGGAEAIFVPEKPFQLDQVVAQIQKGQAKGKASSILIAAEGQKPGRAYDLSEAIRKKGGFEAKVCILGHIQRGGAPTASDRNLASQMGSAAISLLLEGHCDVMVGKQDKNLVRVDLGEALSKKKSLDTSKIQLAGILSN